MIGDDNVMEQFTKAYEELSDAIFRHCYFRIGDKEKAKDLMQSTFTKSWQYISQGTEVQNLRLFLYRVANNLIIDEYRKKKEVSLDNLMDKGFDFGFEERGKMDKNIDAKEAITVFNQIDEKYRTAVMMRYIDEMSPKEIAEAIGESENSVSVRIHRGLKQAKELLDTNGR